MLSHMSPSTISWIGSVESCLLMCVGAIAGPLFDAGYFSSLLIVGNIMVAFGLMMTSLADQYYQILLAQGICLGISAGLLFTPAVAILPQYFRRRRALVNGIAASGSSIGGVVFPIVWRQLQLKIGFAWATRVLGFVALATGAVAVSVMRMRFRPTEKRGLIDLSAFREIQYVTFLIGAFLGFMGFYNFVVYVQPFAIEKGIVNDNLGFYLVPILNAASALGRIAPNMMADYIGAYNVLVPLCTITSLLAFCWIAVHSTAGIIVLAALYGFWSGGFVSLPPIAIMTVTKDFRKLGTRIGMAFCINAVALLIGTPIGGALRNATGSYLGLQLFCACSLAVCTVILAILRFMRSGPKFRYRT